MKTDEQKLIHRAIEGDRDAFGAVVEKYKSAVYALAYEFTKNTADAQDISQEAFIKAYLKLSTLRDKTKFAAWLHRITYSLCLDWQRKQARKKEVSFDELVKTNGQEQRFANFPKMPEEELEKKELVETILAALDSLSTTNRLTTMMYYMNGLSYREIASFELAHSEKPLRPFASLTELPLRPTCLPPACLWRGQVSTGRRLALRWSYGTTASPDAWLVSILVSIRLRLLNPSRLLNPAPQPKSLGLQFCAEGVEVSSF